MSKKKKDEAVEDTVESTYDAIEASIIKDFGNVIFSGDCIKSMREIVIPVSPAINIGLGGGIPEGTWHIFTGKPKVGKTTTALHFAVKAQDIKYANPKLCPEGRLVVYINVEGRIKERDLAAFPGLDMKRFKMVQSEPGNILTAEKFLAIAERYITQVPGCVVIIDSYSALSTEAEQTGAMDEMQRADGAKLLAKFCRKVANVVPVNKNIVVGITHVQSDPSGKSTGDREKSGNAVAYQADSKMWGKWAEAWTIGDKQIGQIAHWDVKFSSLGSPGTKIDSYVRYGIGIDEHMEIAQMAIDLGIIVKTGAWYYIPDFEDNKKFNGVENIRKVLIDNPDICNRIEKELYDTMGIKQC